MSIKLGLSKADKHTPNTTSARGPQYDWVAVARVLGPRVHAAWLEPQFAAFRADDGKGPVPKGVVIPATQERGEDGKPIPGTGSAWVTVCEHGTMYRTDTGGAAHRVNGPARATWCTPDTTNDPDGLNCEAGDRGSMPFLSAKSSPDAIVKPTTAPPVKPDVTPVDTKTTAKAGTPTPPK